MFSLYCSSACLGTLSECSLEQLMCCTAWDGISETIVQDFYGLLMTLMDNLGWIPIRGGIR